MSDAVIVALITGGLSVIGTIITVAIRGVGRAEMEAMRQRWPDCEVTEE